MKKMLYLIPVLFIVLSFTPFALYKDEVNFGSNFHSLSPEHWKQLNLETSFSGGVPEDGSTVSVEPSALSDNASFLGFPFGAYFSKSDITRTSTFTSETNVSAISWLWTSANLVLIISSGILAAKLNHKPRIT